jgi:hypothetical protein
VAAAGGGQVGEVHDGSGVFGQPAHHRGDVERLVGDQAQSAGQHDLVQCRTRVVEPAQRFADARAMHLG